MKIFRQYAQRQKNGYTSIDSDITVEYNLHYINHFELVSYQTIFKYPQIRVLILKNRAESAIKF